MLLETDSLFSFGRFVRALDEVNPAVSIDRLADIAVQAIWFEEWDIPPSEGAPEAWMAQGVLRHPADAGDRLSSQPQPLNRMDLFRALHDCNGLPEHPDLAEIATQMAKMAHPAMMRHHPNRNSAFLFLRAVAWNDYPRQGRKLLVRVILPYRRLEELCKRHDLRPPEVLRQRLAGRWVDDQSIVPETPGKGRPPKHADRYLTQFRARIQAGTVTGSPSKEARILWLWLKETLKTEGLPHSDSDLPAEKTIRNRITELFDFEAKSQKRN